VPILKHHSHRLLLGTALVVLLSATCVIPPANAKITYDPKDHTLTVSDEVTVPGIHGPKPITPVKPVKPITPLKPFTPCNDNLRVTANLKCYKPDPKPDIPAIGYQAAASITLPKNTPQYGPQPTQNKWGIIPIGYPVWLWTSDNQTVITQTVTNQGLIVSLTATRQNITYNLGDGSQTTCANFTPRPLHNDPFQQSPTCGHTYQTPGHYTITATTTWNVTWQINGQSGTITITDTTTTPTPLPIGELHTVIIPEPTP